MFVINRRIVRTRIAKAVRRAIRELGMPTLEASLAQRVIFAETAGTGLLAHEIDRRSAAAQEVAAMTAELLRVTA